MFEIYVKWNELSKHAEQLDGCSRWIGGYVSRVDNVKTRIRLSDSVSVPIKARLARDSEQLEKIAKDLSHLSDTLRTIASMYRETETGMLSD